MTWPEAKPVEKETNATMAGRTERVNARDLLDRAEGIFFEGDVARGWLAQLAKRTTSALEAAKCNRYFETEWKGEYEELNEALQALNTAATKLEMFQAAVKRRGA